MVPELILAVHKNSRMSEDKPSDINYKLLSSVAHKSSHKKKEGVQVYGKANCDQSIQNKKPFEKSSCKQE